MLSPAIRSLADQVGVEIGARCANKSYYFDGKSIADHYFKTTWSDFLEDYVIDPSKKVNLLDHDILHEICHFIVAEPIQRNLPEFGLGNLGLGCYDIISAPQVVDSDDFLRKNCLIQEYTTQQLCVMLGRRLKISVDLAQSLGYAHSWDNYEQKKLCELGYNRLLLDSEKKFVLEMAGALFHPFR